MQRMHALSNNFSVIRDDDIIQAWRLLVVSTSVWKNSFTTIVVMTMGHKLISIILVYFLLIFLQILLTLSDNFQVSNLLPIIRLIKDFDSGSIIIQASAASFQNCSHSFRHSACKIQASIKISCFKFWCSFHPFLLAIKTFLPKSRHLIQRPPVMSLTCWQVNVEISCSWFAFIDLCCSLHKPEPKYCIAITWNQSLSKSDVKQNQTVVDQKTNY